MSRALGRIEPKDTEHIEKYPLTALPKAEQPVQVPVPIGVNWYTDFDNPQKDSSGHYWIGRSKNLGSIRGGHCVVLKAHDELDLAAWWAWYNQVNEGICVGEGLSRMMSLLNRWRFQPRWLYDRCKERDGFPNEEGTEVRVGLDVLRDMGHVRARVGEAQSLTAGEITRYPNPQDGISANRWISSMDDLARTLGTPNLDYALMLNSWGKNDYPHYVRIPLDTLNRLNLEGGEMAVVTDR